MFGLFPKNVKLCPGCPPKKIEPVHIPKFTLSAPKPAKKEKDTKVVQIVNLSKYKNKNNRNSLF